MCKDLEVETILVCFRDRNKASVTRSQREGACGMIGGQRVRRGLLYLGPCRLREFVGPGKVSISYTQRHYSSVVNSTDPGSRLPRFEC